MDKLLHNSKINLGESIRQRLKNLSTQKGRPFDEVLRYYAMERFLYRLSVSPYVQKFFLKGGLMLKVWNSIDHRATMDIDLLAKTSNQIENLQNIITNVSEIEYIEDAITFNVSNLIFHRTQTTGDYDGVSCRFSAQLFTTKMPILIDIGFNDKIIPQPEKIYYPTLLEMPNPILFGYTLETAFAEKFESIVKLASVNTRMKDFYDIWNMIRYHRLEPDRIKKAVNEVFSNRGTALEYPASFKPEFFDHYEIKQRWDKFLILIGKEPISFREVISDLSVFVQKTIYE